MAASAEEESTVALPEVEKKPRRGHIGLVVLGSIAGGLILGFVLVLGVFAGRREDVITGAALIALAFGMLMLVELARRRTDQPQPWALLPALASASQGLRSSSSRRVIASSVGWGGSGRLCLRSLSSGRYGGRAAPCTTGRVERFFIRHSPS